MQKGQIENELEIMSYTDNFTEGCSKKVKRLQILCSSEYPGVKHQGNHHREGNKSMLTMKDFLRQPKRRKELGDRMSWGKGS